MTWCELLDHVKAAKNCQEPEARRQIGLAIGDYVLPVRWADEKPPRWAIAGLTPLDDTPPHDAVYWQECETDKNDPNRVLEPRPYDPALVDEATAQELDKSRRFRAPLFDRKQVEKSLWPAKSTSGLETRATAALKQRLEENNTMTRGEALEFCQKDYPALSERARRRVWSRGREAAGLDPKAPAGRKPRPKR